MQGQRATGKVMRISSEIQLESGYNAPPDFVDFSKPFCAVIRRTASGYVPIDLFVFWDGEKMNDMISATENSSYQVRFVKSDGSWKLQINARNSGTFLYYQFG